MNVSRAAHSAIRLGDGTVLVVGWGTPETFDPSVEKWSYTGPLNSTRNWAPPVLLNDGKVLVSGGDTGSGTPSVTRTAEIFNPATRAWTYTGSMYWLRARHTATRLLNGEVLVSGGEINSSPLEFVEVFNPASGEWRSTGSMGAARDGHGAVLLQNGKVLVVGGWGGNGCVLTAELFDPGTETWGPAGSLPDCAIPVLLTDGRVLALVGYGTAWIFDPNSSSWAVTGSMNIPRGGASLVLLGDGTVLVSGGGLVNEAPAMLSSSEIYDRNAGTWSLSGDLTTSRWLHTMTLLLNGKVLAVGGRKSLNDLDLGSAELYTP